MINLGIDKNGLIVSSDNDTADVKPIRLGENGKVLLADTNESVGYLQATNEGFLSVAGFPSVTVTDIAAGSRHSLFLTSEGTVYSSGYNQYGQLGRIVAAGNANYVNLGKIEGLSGVQAVAVGDSHSLFLLSDGTVYSCGYNNYGQLGRAVATGSPTNVNLGKIEGLSDVKSIAVHGSHSLFLLTDDTVFSCGQNNYGQLGRVVATGSTTVVNLGVIDSLTNVQTICAGGAHSLFILSDKTVWSCGYNSFGQLGRAVATGSATSVNLGQITGISNVQTIAAGSSHSLFLKTDALVYSCGYNTYGQLGRAVATGSPTLVNLGPITTLPDVQGIAAGTYHSLFLLHDGTVFSGGYNNYGQLGRAVATGSNTTANLGKIDGLAGVQEMAGGEGHSLFLLQDNTAYSCGWSANGQLGQLKTNGSPTKVNLGEVIFSYITITQEYQLRNGSRLSATTYFSVEDDADYTVQASTFQLYDCIGYKLDGGPLQTSDTVTLLQVQEAHTITFVYRRVVVVTEEYRNEANDEILEAKQLLTEYDLDYISTAPNIQNYSCIGHKLNGGSLQTGTTVTISQIQTDNTVTFVYDKTGSCDCSETPAGAITAFAVQTIPSDWLECAGQAVSRQQYSTLFAAIGTFYGAGNGSTTFNLPDLSGQSLHNVAVIYCIKY